MLSPDCPVAELTERPRGHSSSPELATTTLVIPAVFARFESTLYIVFLAFQYMYLRMFEKSLRGIVMNA